VDSRIPLLLHAAGGLVVLLAAMQQGKELMSEQSWYRDREGRRFLRTYLFSLAALMLAWEVLQLPLYTIWRDEHAFRIAFAVAHCTAGDVMIGAAALLIALLAVRALGIDSWPWGKIASLTTLIGVGYTAASEWVNTVVRESWQYSALMPTVEVGSVAIGLSPLLQWLTLPSLAIYAARRACRVR